MLALILSFFLSDPGGHVKAPCLVSRNWRSVALDILYETVSPKSMHAAQLLLRTLGKDTVGAYRPRIRRLCLPIYSTPSQSTAQNGVTVLKYVTGDESGVPNVHLASSQRGVLQMDHDKHQSTYAKILSGLIEFCPSATVIHSPFLSKHPYHKQFLPRTRRVALRDLVLSGHEVLDMFVKDVLIIGKGSNLFPNLRSLAFFDFNTHSPHLSHMFKQISDREDQKPLLPGLEHLHLQEGVLTPDFLPEFLTALGATLTHLTILKMRAWTFGLSESQKSHVSQAAIQNVKTLTIGIDELLSREHNDNEEDGIVLKLSPSIFESLECLEVRLCRWGGGYTPLCFAHKQLVSGGIPKDWYLLQHLPSWVKEVHLIAYHPPKYEGILRSGKALEQQIDLAPSGFSNGLDDKIKILFEKRFIG